MNSCLCVLVNVCIFLSILYRHKNPSFLCVYQFICFVCEYCTTHVCLYFMNPPPIFLVTPVHLVIKTYSDSDSDSDSGFCYLQVLRVNPLPFWLFTGTQSKPITFFVIYRYSE